jgi:hypothetical protein
MHLPALKRLLLKSKAAQKSANTTEQTAAAEAPKALPLLKMVLFANAAMLLRTVSLMVSPANISALISLCMLIEVLCCAMLSLQLFTQQQDC